MKVLKIIMAKGYSFEESEAITRRIFDEYEAQPLGLSILARVALVVDKEPEPIEEPETETASREESTAPGEAMEEPATGEESTETGTTAETATGSRGYITINGDIMDTLPRSGSRHAFRIAPQRTEPAQPYTTTTPRNKTPPRGCYSFTRFPPRFQGVKIRKKTGRYFGGVYVGKTGLAPSGGINGTPGEVRKKVRRADGKIFQKKL